MAADPNRIAELRDHLEGIVAGNGKARGVLPFGVVDIDRRLPKGGLALGALHEVAGGANGAVVGAAAIAFPAGLASRTGGQVLWCFSQADLFSPALAQSGLTEDRVVFFEADDDKAILGCFDDLNPARAFGLRLRIQRSQPIRVSSRKAGFLCHPISWLFLPKALE